MSLNEIFALINRHCAEVDSIVDSIDKPTTTLINQHYDSALYYSRRLNSAISDHFYWIDVEQTSAINYLLLSHERVVAEYYDSIQSLRSAVRKSFSTYYATIIYKMESAITLTWNEIDRQIAVVNNRIDQIDTNIEAQIEAEIEESESWLTGLIDTLESALGFDIQSLWDGIAETASEIYGAIEAKAADIYTTVDGWVRDLWDYVVPFFEWVEEEFEAYYKAVRRWIIDKATEIYEVIETKVEELKDFVDESVGDVWRQLIKVQIALEATIANLEATLRSWVTKGVNEIEALLTDLSILADWRFQFLNLFMSKPELSILQVLNRDEKLFRHYKPYWQAFFTRVMEA